MSKLLTNQISNYSDNGPVEVKDGINVASGKPLQVAGASGTSGQYLKSTGSSVAWTTFPTIPAAQVSVDWNATSGISQILNKPTLATVATSGSYNDLLNTPTIPSAQIQSDWTQSNSAALDFIKNKPSLFDGQYTSLTGAPTVPATLNDLADVNIPSPSDNLYIKWDASSNRWIQGSDNAGLSNVVEDLTPQLGGTLDANGQVIDMGTNNITDAGVGNWNTAYGWGNHASAGYLTSDANTTYSQQAIQDSADVKLRLTDSGGTNDDIKLTAGTNITFSAVSANGFTINSSGGSYANNDVDTHLNVSGASSGQILSWNGSDYAWVADQTGGGGSGATVTTDDSAPSSPSDGDLWWKSDEGRLKVYYQDTDSSQWVDASPPANSGPRYRGTAAFTNFGSNPQGTWTGAGITATYGAISNPTGYGSFQFTFTMAHNYGDTDSYLILAQGHFNNDSTAGRGTPLVVNMEKVNGTTFIGTVSDPDSGSNIDDAKFDLFVFDA